MSADLDAVIAEVGVALGAVPEFSDAVRRHVTPNVSRVTPPAVIVEPSNEQVLDNTYGPQGMDVYLLDVTVVVALYPTATWGKLAPFVRKSGASSVQAAIEGHDYVSCSAVVVPRYEIVVATFAGNQYLGAQFRAEAGG